MHAAYDGRRTTADVSSDVVEQLNVDQEMRRDLVRGYFNAERVVDSRTLQDGYVCARVFWQPSASNPPWPVLSARQRCAVAVASAPADGSAREVAQYYCKWQGLPYSQCTWEDAAAIQPKFQNEIDDYMTRRDSRHVPSPVFRRPVPADYVRLSEQPHWVAGGEVCGKAPVLWACARLVLMRSTIRLGALRVRLRRRPVARLPAGGRQLDRIQLGARPQRYAGGRNGPGQDVPVHYILVVPVPRPAHLRPLPRRRAALDRHQYANPAPLPRPPGASAQQVRWV